MTTASEKSSVETQYEMAMSNHDAEAAMRAQQFMLPGQTQGNDANDFMEYMIQSLHMLHLESQEGDVMTHELCRARGANMEPREVWRILYLAAEKHSLDESCVMPSVVRMYFIFEDKDIKFFIELFRWFVYNYKGRDTKSLLSSEIGRHTEPVSQIQDKFGPSINESHANGELLRQSMYNVAMLTAMLVYENIVDLSDVWPYLGGKTYLPHLDRIYEEVIKKAVVTSSYEKLCDSSGGYISSSSKYEVIHKTYEKRPSLEHPLFAWVLYELLVADPGNESVLQVFQIHPKLACAYPLLRAPLSTSIKSKLDRGWLTPKVLNLFLPAKLLGPHFGEDFDFFQEACDLLRTHMETHRDLAIILIRSLILPALFLCENSADASVSVWSILVKLDTETRWNIYVEWDEVLYDANGMPNESEPTLNAVTRLVKDDIASLVQLLTYETVESAGRAIAVLATKSPLVAWDAVLCCSLWTDGLQFLLSELVYSYCDSFAQDTLMFVIYNILTEVQGQFVFQGHFPFEENGVEYKQWFVSFSELTGDLFAHSSYLQNSSLVTYITYLEQQLPTSAACVQLVLDLLTSMTGVRSFKELFDSEVASLGGSTLLKRQVFLPVTSEDLERLSECKEVDAPAVGAGRLHEILPSSVGTFFQALCHDSHGLEIMRTLLAEKTYRDVPSYREKHHSQASLFGFLQFLRVVDIVGSDADGIFESHIGVLREEIASPSSVPFFILNGRCLRSPIEAHCLDFVDEISTFYDAHGVNPRLNAFFWTLEAYDIYVPESEYVHEIRQIQELGKDSPLSPGAVAEQRRLVESLEASHATHKAHVAWILPHLPKLDVSDTVNVLHNVVRPRACLSQQDAHFAFCFLARTLDDSLLLLDALLDPKYLFELLCSTEYESHALEQLVREVWQDLVSWSSQRELGMSGIAKDICSTCTLFRPGMEVESNLQRWQEGTMSAICAALNESEISTVKNALRMLISVIEYMPQQGSIFSLVQAQLNALASRTEDGKVAALIRDATETFGEEKMTVEG